MRALWKDILTALFTGFLLPGVLLNLMTALVPEETFPAVETTPTETVPQETAAGGTDLPMRFRTAGATREEDTDTYLIGVVLAEMPTDFEPEALKAQAVAARTYTQKAFRTGGKHGDGSVCSDPGCCQAYLSAEDYLQKGGTREGLEKVRAAVEATSGQVLTYEGALIEAVYFSCSGGSTEDAAAVWGAEFPYLQAVPSPGEEGSACYWDTVTFTPEEFMAALGRELWESPRSWFGTTTYTEGGGVDSMVIGNKAYSGTWLRSRLGLRSTAFTILAEENSLTITTRGYGHRVGMSQYGADAMAVRGSTYREILAHYYPGTVLTTLEP